MIKSYIEGLKMEKIPRIGDSYANNNKQVFEYVGINKMTGCVEFPTLMFRRSKRGGITNVSLFRFSRDIYRCNWKEVNNWRGIKKKLIF
jgi:hypothetical protein